MRTPSAFVSDLGPFPAFVEDAYTEALGLMGRSMPRPKAILVMSGHWLAQGELLISAAPRPATIKDYGGFPESFYDVSYPCPGAPAAAQQGVESLRAAGFPARLDPARGLDHGAWVPLTRLYPGADVPVAQITVPAGWEPRRIMAAGRALAPLREHGVLLLASGALSHNLRLMKLGERGARDAWALKFDKWLTERLDAGDLDALADYRRLAPEAELAAPTTEHFDPLFFALGAAGPDRPAHFYHAVEHGSAVMRAFALGAEIPAARR